MQLAPPVLDGLPNNCIGQIGPTLITSLTYVVIPGLTWTPGRGTYLLMFSGTGSMSNKAYTGSVELFVAGVAVPHTRRRIQKNNAGDETTLACQCRATINDGEALEPRFVTDGGTMSLEERTFTVVRIG